MSPLMGATPQMNDVERFGGFILFLLLLLNMERYTPLPQNLITHDIIGVGAKNQQKGTLTGDREFGRSIQECVYSPQSLGSEHQG